ncbi:hypothetical protein F4677DRAFT_333948 [Hypoxylon crocopeplum]|nr:hypothetical protein F4677DRAFT_333948 [Hypoxylon crocopeplum]
MLEAKFWLEQDSTLPPGVIVRTPSPVQPLSLPSFPAYQMQSQELVPITQSMLPISRTLAHSSSLELSQGSSYTWNTTYFHGQQVGTQEILKTAIASNETAILDTPWLKFQNKILWNGNSALQSQNRFETALDCSLNHDSGWDHISANVGLNLPSTLPSAMSSVMNAGIPAAEPALNLDPFRSQLRVLHLIANWLLDEELLGFFNTLELKFIHMLHADLVETFPNGLPIARPGWDALLCRSQYRPFHEIFAWIIDKVIRHFSNHFSNQGVIYS